MGPPPEQPTLTCRVCGTENPATRLFCRRCAADLRAPVPVPGEPVPAPPEPVPIRPILLGGGIAAGVLALLVGIILVLGGRPSPSASPATTAGASPAASAAVSPAPTGAPTSAAGPSASPGEAPPRPARIREFVAPELVDCADAGFPGTVHVSWRVVRATGVSISIDGPGIFMRYDGLSGEADVPFSCGEPSHTYLLTTIGGVGEPATRELVVRVSAD